jgi:mRNA interferase MazF
MKRGDLYRVYRGSRNDPKDYRVFLVVSRQLLVDSRFSTLICAPVYTMRSGLPTQVDIGVDEGLKHDSAVCCDELISIRKTLLTHYVGALSPAKMQAVNVALRTALATG